MRQVKTNLETRMTTSYEAIFTPEILAQMLPATRSDEFFEALFGDPEEGAYDIRLAFAGHPRPATYLFELRLIQRPGKCLVCNLTHGLPEVFSRHPVINLKGLTAAIATRLGLAPERASAQLKATREVSRELHIVPLVIEVL